VEKRLAVVLWHHAVGVATLIRLLLIGLVVVLTHLPQLSILLLLVAVVEVETVLVQVAQADTVLHQVLLLQRVQR
jgi:hypothetical protein